MCSRPRGLRGCGNIQRLQPRQRGKGRKLVSGDAAHRHVEFFQVPEVDQLLPGKPAQVRVFLEVERHGADAGDRLLDERLLQPDRCGKAAGMKLHHSGHGSDRVNQNQPIWSGGKGCSRIQQRTAEEPVAFTVQIVPSALQELQAFKPYYRRQISDAIDEQLPHQPTLPTHHRKPLSVTDASFPFEPPLWELRIGDVRVFYDVDEENDVVYVRAIRDKPPHSTTEDVL